MRLIQIKRRQYLAARADIGKGAAAVNPQLPAASVCLCIHGRRMLSRAGGLPLAAARRLRDARIVG